MQDQDLTLGLLFKFKKTKKFKKKKKKKEKEEEEEEGNIDGFKLSVCLIQKHTPAPTSTSVYYSSNCQASLVHYSQTPLTTLRGSGQSEKQPFPYSKPTVLYVRSNGWLGIG